MLPGPERFPDLRAGLPQASPNVLAQRLRQLERAGGCAATGSPRPRLRESTS
jgi:DNA-binding HxlR family transcriptional regulator